jgi:putative colanic acid biosynthesis UDP-glucose lipid carrier transferase
VIENQVDEIYCSLNEMPNKILEDLIDFADENNKTIKFIPDTKEIFQKFEDRYDFPSSFDTTNHTS